MVAIYEGRVRRLARRLVGDEHLADDLAQQAFLSAYRALPSFRGDSRFSTWLYRITVNACRMHLRREKLVHFESEPEEFALPDPGAGPLESADRRALREALEKALPRLPWGPRQAIALFYLEGVSYPEIAQILDTPLGTVKAWISRGLVRLRSALMEEKLR